MSDIEPLDVTKARRWIEGSDTNMSAEATAGALAHAVIAMYEANLALRTALRGIGVTLRGISMSIEETVK